MKRRMNSMRSSCVPALVGLALSWYCARGETVLAAPSDAAPPATFVLGQEGCSMAHCDPAMSDRDPISAPLGPGVVQRWHDESVQGPSVGLGCASNGNIAACSLAGSSGTAGPFLVAYDAEGHHLWDAGPLLDSYAFTSAPMMGEDGSVIAADDRMLIRFDSDGQVRWSTPTAGGIPISPTLVQGAIVLATKPASGTNQAPVSAYDLETGVKLAQLSLSSPSGNFGTVNTPAARSGRVYIATQLLTASGGADPSHLGRLYAIDVAASAADPAQRLNVAWTFDFRGPSGASPLIVPDAAGRARIFFDGHGLAGAPADTPLFFGIVDNGSAPGLLWTYALPGTAQASAAADPRGGLWVFGARDPRLIRLDADTGLEAQVIDVSAFVHGTSPGSAMSITGPDDRPVMVVAATSLFQSRVLALDLVAGTGLWAFNTARPARGQYPVVRAADGSPVVIAATSTGGIYGISGVVP